MQKTEAAAGCYPDEVLPCCSLCLLTSCCLLAGWATAQGLVGILIAHPTNASHAWWACQVGHSPPPSHACLLPRTYRNDKLELRFEDNGDGTFTIILTEKATAGGGRRLLASHRATTEGDTINSVGAAASGHACCKCTFRFSCPRCIGPGRVGCNNSWCDAPVCQEEHLAQQPS